LADLEGCFVQPLTYITLQLAKKLIEHYDFQLFDSIVVASALEAGCDILYSEDLHNSLVVENQMKIVVQTAGTASFLAVTGSP
jgi:predicted nucleic acid-binding protein